MLVGGCTERGRILGISDSLSQAHAKHRGPWAHDGQRSQDAESHPWPTEAREVTSTPHLYSPSPPHSTQEKEIVSGQTTDTGRQHVLPDRHPAVLLTQAAFPGNRPPGVSAEGALGSK